MKFYSFLFLIAVVMTFSSCDEKRIMIPEFEVPTSNRVVLIEELTGVSCPNCPKGTAQIAQLKEQYGEKLIAVGIHGFFLSEPTAESKYDFRNAFAKDLEDYLKPWDGKPAASINRVQYTEELSISFPDLWSGYIDQELEKEHVMEIEIKNSFDPESRKLDIQATIIPLKDFSQDDKLHISIMILESEIEDAQEDPTTIIEDYVHNHVLRTMLTNYKGDPIQTDLTKLVSEKFNFSFTIPEPEDGNDDWNPAHMEVVACVNIVNGDMKDVLQAAEAKVIQ